MFCPANIHSLKTEKKKYINKKCERLCHLSFHFLPLHSVLREKCSFTGVF